jgi:lysophospholipase L1-like esterase
MVIVAVGTNDAGFSEASYRKEVEAMMNVLGSQTNVVWVNVDSNSPQLAAAARGVNVALQDATSEWHHLRIGDWNHYVTTVPGFSANRGSDGTHYTVAGYQIRARWMVRLTGDGPQPR